MPSRVVGVGAAGLGPGALVGPVGLIRFRTGLGSVGIEALGLTLREGKADIGGVGGPSAC